MKERSSIWWIALIGIIIYFWLQKKAAGATGCSTCGAIGIANTAKASASGSYKPQLGSPSQMFDNSGNLVCPTGYHADTDPLTGNPMCSPDNAPVLTKVIQFPDPCSDPLTWTAAQCLSGN